MLRRCTLLAPWSGGDRVVLAAFTVWHFARLPAATITSLQNLGFKVPGLSTGDVVLDSPPRPVAIRNLGWSCAQAVDHQCKSIASANMLIADLSTTDGQKLLRFWLGCPYLVGVFMAPPCGTASLARLLPVPAPPPLRDDCHPDGFPWLQGTNKIRAQKAKGLYNVVADTCEFSLDRPVLLVVENPRTSLMWKTTMWARARLHCQIQVDLQNCSYGGDRPKWTSICCIDNTFLSLRWQCPGGRCLLNHKAWGRSSLALSRLSIRKFALCALCRTLGASGPLS